MIDLIFAVILLVVTGAGGARLLRRYRAYIPSPTDVAMFSLALGLGILAYVTLAVGLLGWLHRPVAYMLLLAIALWARPELLGFLQGVSRLPVRIRENWRDLTWFGRLALVVLCFQVSLNLVGALAPPAGVDPMTTHLAAPKVYLRAQRIYEMKTAETWYYPFTIQMLFLFGMLLRGPQVAVLLHLGLGLLTMIGVYRLARLSEPPSTAWLAASIFYTITDVAVGSSSGTIDLGVCAFQFMAFFAYVRWTQSGGNVARFWLIISGLMAGLSSASKLTGAYVVLVLVTLVLYHTVKRRGLSVQSVLRAPVLFGSLAVLVPAPWFLRSWLLTGNPFYPLLASIFNSGRTWQFPLEPVGVGFSTLLMPWTVTMMPYKSGWVGPLFLSFLPLVLIDRVWRRFGNHLAFVLSFLVLWSIIYSRVRVGLAAFAVLAVPIAVVIAHLATRTQVVRALVGMSVAGWLAVSCLADVRLQARRFPVVLGLETPQAYLSRVFPRYYNYHWYDDLQFINQNLPDDAKVLVWDRRGFYLERDYAWAMSLVTGYLPPGVVEDWSRLRSELEALNITHVAFSEGKAPNADREVLNPLRTTLVESGCLVPVYASETMSLFRIECP